MKKVVWGVLGTARIARERRLPGMRKSGLLEIRAIAARDLAQARKAADALGIPGACGSYDALLADPEIEAIYIPLPNRLTSALVGTCCGARRSRARFGVRSRCLTAWRTPSRTCV